MSENIKPNTNLLNLQMDYTSIHSVVAAYFDKNLDGNIDEKEASIFNSANFEVAPSAVKIETDDEIIVFSDMGDDKGEKFYSAGNTPVAVVDCFSGIGRRHGLIVSNMIKKHNPDIAISAFDISPMAYYNPFQKALAYFFERFPKLQEAAIENDYAADILNKIFPFETTADVYKKTLEVVKDSGRFDALNLSSGLDCTYEEINRLCEGHLGVRLTPANIASYRDEIKEILKSKSNERMKYIRDFEDSIKISKIVDLVDEIESIEAPVYLAGSYKTLEGEDTFNLMALAKNTLCVEGGADDVTASNISSNSFSRDEKTGEKRLENSLIFDGHILGYSTSFATPIRLAKDLRK